MPRRGKRGGGSPGCKDENTWIPIPLPVGNYVAPAVTSGPEPAAPPQPERAAAFMKTKMCKFFLLGACTRGTACQFAHDNLEMQPLPDLFRTKICKSLVATGNCNDPDCRYAHSKDELRTAPEPSEAKLKRQTAEQPPRPQIQGGSRQPKQRPKHTQHQEAKMEKPTQVKHFQQPQQMMFMGWPGQQQLELVALEQMASGLAAQAAALQMEHLQNQEVSYPAPLQHMSVMSWGAGMDTSLPADWSRNQEPEAKVQAEDTAVTDEGHHLVVKNTFLEFCDGPPAPLLRQLRPVMSASARLCSLGGESDDISREVTPRQRPPNQTEQPVQINPISLRSTMSNHSLRSNLSNNSLCSLATLAEDEPFMRAAMPGTYICHPAADAMHSSSGLGQALNVMPDLSDGGDWVVKNTFIDLGPAQIPQPGGGRLRPIASAAGRLEALVEEGTHPTISAPGQIQQRTLSINGDDCAQNFNRQVTNASTASGASVSSEVSHGSGESNEPMRIAGY
mmetsp:Transcript_57834/g.102744  ORF Transcript_57834/g.102744 Transcript_57834/m.102744 type:complete len:505 (-) Transcript_57834:104-1618(-)